MEHSQLSIFEEEALVGSETTYKKIAALLSDDLDFHSANSSFASHQFHAFPAKFPPQLPRKFITALTQPGDAVLDPMMGSGTTLVEAQAAERKAMGFDTDPLAVRITKAKTTPIDTRKLCETGESILENVRLLTQDERQRLREEFHRNLEANTSKFLDYWFDNDTQDDLCALVSEIRRIPSICDVSMNSIDALVAFFEVVFSAIIITKSGGVSLALDLAHTRPHRAKVVYDTEGQLLWGKEHLDQQRKRLRFISKQLRSPFGEFHHRFQRNLAHVPVTDQHHLKPVIEHGDAQRLPLSDNCVDLIVTSPPYASNAIDYMRAHKFSLVWLGYSLKDLGPVRSRAIGGESTTGLEMEMLPSRTDRKVKEVAILDEKKGKVLHRYYSEMTKVLREMFRVLKPGKTAIVVVGSSVMRGRDTETGICLAEIGRSIGFDVPAIGVRNLDRNRRMLPASNTLDKNSQIQQRMHQEYVIGFLKPHKSEL